eukprot:1277489-Pleurochrysis_carterae.AAC.1
MPCITGEHAPRTWSTESRSGGLSCACGTAPACWQLSQAPLVSRHTPKSVAHAHGSSPRPRAAGSRSAHRQLNTCTAPGAPPAGSWSTSPRSSCARATAAPR